MKPKPSTRSFFAEWKASAGLSMFDLMHGYVYLRWPYFYIANAVGRHPMLASSGYVAEVDTTRCVACGTCAKSCQFEAITYVDGRKVIDAIRCLGCGVCVQKCARDAIQLRRDPARGRPLEIEDLVTAAAG